MVTLTVVYMKVNMTYCSQLPLGTGFLEVFFMTRCSTALACTPFPVVPTTRAGAVMIAGGLAAQGSAISCHTPVAADAACLQEAASMSHAVACSECNQQGSHRSPARRVHRLPLKRHTQGHRLSVPI